MKTLSAAAVLLSLAAACGDAHSNQRALQTCALVLAPDASAADVQQAVNDVLERRVDPCAGAVADLRSAEISLERIDDELDPNGRRIFTLVFRIARGDFKPLNEP